MLTGKVLYQVIVEPEIIAECQALDDSEAPGIVFTVEELSKIDCVGLKLSLLDVKTLSETHKAILNNDLDIK